MNSPIDIAKADCLPFTQVALGTYHTALPRAFVLPFEVTAFSEDDFARYGIVRPPSIVRSVAKRQAEYLAGRRAALAALREAGDEANDLPIGTDRAPAWPPGFIGSVSHTDRLAAAVAMRMGTGVSGIGIDIERLILPGQLAAVRDSVVDDRECRELAALADRKGWSYALTVAFSAKESFYKATAATVGSIFDFTALRIVRCDAADACIEAEVVETLAPSLPAGQRHLLRWVDVFPDVVLTHCVW